MLISIIGIPWVRSCFVLGGFCFFPFGQEAIDREELTGRDRRAQGGRGGRQAAQRQSLALNRR